VNSSKEAKTSSFSLKGSICGISYTHTVIEMSPNGYITGDADGFANVVTATS
jgi:hypothetical protein